jgi:hypothetical protein
MTKIAGSLSISLRHGSSDPDPYQSVMDPQHCYERYKSFLERQETEVYL